MNNANTNRFEALETALLQDDRTHDQACKILELRECELAHIDRLYTKKTINRETHRTVWNRETVRCLQRLESLAEFHGIQ